MTDRTAQDIQELLCNSLPLSDRPFLVPSEATPTDAPARLLIAPEDSEQVWVLTITGPYTREPDQVAALAVAVGLADDDRARWAAGS